MQLHTLKRATARQHSKRVGRGGKRGKTSGRGTKGQNARAGHKKWPQIREQLKKLPKRRGYSFKSIEDKPVVINVSALERMFSVGDTVNPKTLFERGLVRPGSIIKILGDGELTKKLTIVGCKISTSAKEKIEKSGGKIEVK